MAHNIRYQTIRSTSCCAKGGPVRWLALKFWFKTQISPFPSICVTTVWLFLPFYMLAFLWPALKKRTWHHHCIKLADDRCEMKHKTRTVPGNLSPESWIFIGDGTLRYHTIRESEIIDDKKKLIGTPMLNSFEYFIFIYFRSGSFKEDTTISVLLSHYLKEILPK